MNRHSLSRRDVSPGEAGKFFRFTACGPDGMIGKKEGIPMRKCYPGGKRKAFNITYDDGVIQDVRFVALLNRYGLKGL